MPDEPSEKLTAEKRAEPAGDGVFSSYGIASAVLGVIAVAAVALAVLMAVAHRGDAGDRADEGKALQAAVDWTNVLINMNKDNVDDSLRKLHEGTIGQLNADFDSTVDPYRKLVQTLQSQTRGQIDSAAIETIHHPQPGPNGEAPQAPKPEPELSEVASRTDTVLVVATSVSQNPGAPKPQTVHWKLRMNVSEVDGRRLISRLEPIR